VIADSKGDIQRGLEVIEFCCGIPHVLKGEYTQGAGPGIDVYSMRQPLGIGRRHHAVQLPGDDPDVDVRASRSRWATPSS
jgi:malonate-semialdehyde dehydrogenase (acetylating)/methylmalonate-semialdehyde dehydrogenase